MRSESHSTANDLAVFAVLFAVVFLIFLTSPLWLDAVVREADQLYRRAWIFLAQVLGGRP